MARVMIDKEYLLSVAQAWANESLGDWIGEIGAWDDKIVEDPTDEDDGNITLESWEWIRNNVKFTITVEEK